MFSGLKRIQHTINLTMNANINKEYRHNLQQKQYKIEKGQK